MSYDAVRNFYRALVSSAELTAHYETLTQSFWLGYRPAKIVAFAAVMGHRFTIAELEYVRLTNSERGVGLGSRKYEIEEETDYSPTAHPHPPASAEEFRRVYGRDVDRESDATGERSSQLRQKPPRK